MTAEADDDGEHQDETRAVLWSGDACRSQYMLQDAFWQSLSFGQATETKYQQALVDNGWETTDDYAALALDKLLDCGFLEGHAARFLRKVPVSKAPSTSGGTPHPLADQGDVEKRRWTWTMVASEIAAYESFCKGKQRRHGFGMAAFSKSRQPPYVASTLLGHKRLNDQRCSLKVSTKELSTSGVPLNAEALKAFGQTKAKQAKTSVKKQEGKTAGTKDKATKRQREKAC
jgi:hypothetical protein